MEKNQNTVILIVVILIAFFVAYQFVWAPVADDVIVEDQSELELSEEVEGEVVVEGEEL